MNTRVLVALAMMLSPFMLNSAFAAQGGNGNGGSGGPSNGDLYGDAVYLYRDDDGVPITLNGCIRPLGADGRVLALNVDLDQDGDAQTPQAIDTEDYDAECDGGDAGLLLMTKTLGDFTAAAEAEDDDELEACDPIKNCTDYVVEAELGRLSLLRSPDRVLDRQYEEAVKALTTGGSFYLDEGGRFVTSGGTFDSPLINLALFREYLLFGKLMDPAPATDLLIFDPTEWALPNGYPYDFVTAAAFALGAGDDKEGTGIDPEIVVRAAGILALAELTVALPTHEFKYEGRTEHFLDFSSFTYVREDTFPGNICYDYLDGSTNSYLRVSMPIIEAVFGLADPDNGEAFVNIKGFALAANDARRVLVFTHDNLALFADSVFETTEITLDNCPPLN